MPVLTPEERIGTVLDGKYRLDRILGEGGFGVVFAATHVGLQRPVAVKLLRAGLAEREEVVTRFLREARATSKLEHPNVIDVRDVVTSPENGVYMVLELLEGETLSSLLARRQVLSLEETMLYVGPILDAMRAAHEAGIVHRDIKPDNVFLSRGLDGQVVPKLLDFGIAKLAETGPAHATATGLVLGTPIYMAPEQAMGRTKEIGPLCDVWSIAVVIYECLTGRYPFDLPPEPSPTSVVLEVITGRIVPLSERRSDLPAGVSEVLDRALARNLEERLGSMRELHDALARAGVAEAHTQPPPPPSGAFHLPPTLVATGPLGGTGPSATRGPTVQGMPGAPAPWSAPGSTDHVVTGALLPRSSPPSGPPAHYTGPILGSPALLTDPGPERERATTTAEIFAGLSRPSALPTWAWAAIAVAALAGTVGVVALSFGLEDPARATEPAPTAAPSPVAAEPAARAPTAPPPPAVEPPPPVAALELDPVGEPTAPEAPTTSAAPRAPRAPREPREPVVAAEIEPAPEPEPDPEPAPEAETEPAGRRPGVVHRAPAVSIEDF